jgi:DNA polymerase III subunit delta'
MRSPFEFAASLMNGLSRKSKEMKFPTGLNGFVGNAGTVEILKRAMRQDRLPHAMIFAGPAGVGKCTLALLIAQNLNCLEPNPDACGHCSACKRIMAVIESRHLDCQTLKEGFCGNCRACKIRTIRHPDVRLIEPEKTTISIDQIREIIAEIAFQPAEARYRVVILDPAEQMRLEAHNSLLKTLEEPPSRTVIILVTTNPYMLLETIRSRSRILYFGEIPHSRIARYLVDNEGRTEEEARLAAALSGGSLAVALDFNTSSYRDVRTQALEFIRMLLNGKSFSEVSEIAAQVSKDKDFFQIWIESVSMLLQDIYYFGIAEDRIGQQDLLDQLGTLAQTVSRSTLRKTIVALGKLKHDLQFNVNRQIALEAMFVSLLSKA